MISISIDHSQDLTLFTVSGEVSADEMIAEVCKFFSSNPTTFALWDLQEANSSNVTTADVDRLVSVLGKYRASRKEGKTALVGSSDYNYGMCRMLKAKAEMHKINTQYYVTRSIDDAFRWLGVVG